MNRKITIITPTLNQSAYIEECIQSVISQNYDNLEFIVIDGGSTDDTLNVLKKYAKYFSHCISEPDKGQSDAINKGLKLATGDIINWLNSDDYLEPGSLEVIHNAFQDDSINVFSGRSRIVKNGREIKKSKGLDIYVDNLAKTIAWARIDQPETYWRKSIVDQIGPLNMNLHYIMDRDWWVKYLMRHGLAGISQSDDIIANFRLHEESKTVSSSNEFNSERDQYFSAILKKSEIDLPLNLEGSFILDSNFPQNENQMPGIANYFLMLLATEKYEQSEFRLFKELYSQINLGCLEEKDAKYLTKLHSRSKIIPTGLHKTIKKIRG